MSSPARARRFEARRGGNAKVGPTDPDEGADQSGRTACNGAWEARGVADLTVEVADHVATVTLDRPPVNAVDRSTMAEIRDAFRGFDDDRQVRAAIFTAAGDRAFMAGADLRTVGQSAAPQDELPATLVTDPPRVARDAMWAIVECAVPVIGAINGPALGAGVAFAACCDILLAAEGRDLRRPRDQRRAARGERPSDPAGRSLQGAGDVLHR